jgi:hypothetical protein
MSNMQEACDPGSGFEEFEYRLVYMRPSEYSDERIAVGVIASTQDGLESRFVSSVDSLGLMAHIFGQDGLEQFHFATAELRRVLRRTPSLDLVTMPTDLLEAGEKTSAFTADRNGLLLSILASSSCLVRLESSRSREILSSPPTLSLTDDLFEQVARLNPVVAQEMFNRKIIVDGKTVELPIYGNRIFGAPVSFVSKDLKMRAESYVARFVWLREHLRQKPRLYLLTRQEGSEIVSARSESSVEELRAIAEASKVSLKLSDSTEEMATLIIQEEAAA